VLDTIGGNIYRLELPSIVRRHPMFQVDNLHPYPVALRPSFPLTTLDANDEYDLDCISVVKTDIIPQRRGKYMSFYTHFKDEQIPIVCHR
jgi:hypothetical protein